MAEATPRPTIKTTPDGSTSAPERIQLVPKYDSPLYTEINIPLPPLPDTPITSTPPTPTSPTSPRSKAHRRTRSLQSFAPFHRRSASIPEVGSPPEEQPNMYENRVEYSMRAVGRSRRKRSGTVDAAIIPAIMVLRAELFTPEEPPKEVDEKVRLEVAR